jgi:dTDP-4-dehydrorhamnose reductase
MPVLIIGSAGQLGRELVKAFGDRAVPLDLPALDIRDPEGLVKILESHRPDTVINTAAYHNVPGCEKDPERAFSLNVLGVRNLRDACRKIEARFVHISTDYVFDGEKGEPYTEEDVPNPLNLYGVTKLAGEFFARQVPVHYVIRISSLFGIGGSLGKGGTNFVKLMLQAARTKDSVAVSSNIRSSPTYAPDAAAAIRRILEDGQAPGVFHVTNSGGCSWYEFAREIFRRTGSRIRLEERVETPELEGGLRRPLYTELRSVKRPPLRPWTEALGDYLAEESALG